MMNEILFKPLLILSWYMTTPIIKYIDSQIKTTPILIIYENAIKKFSEEDVKIILSTKYGIDIWNILKTERSLKEKRNYQHLLREAVMKIYDGKCVISGCERKRCLEAAHIKPVSDCANEEKTDINNVLLLWMDLHKYFDEYDISINPQTMNVEVNDKCDDYEWLKQYIKNVSIKKDCKKYLEYHYNKFLEKCETK